jgi:ABC-type glycerol-3-phosphate transport system substrate-binding protein
MVQFRYTPSVFFLFIIILTVSCVNTIQQTDNKKSEFNSNQVTQLNFIGHWYSEGERKNLIESVVREFEYNNQDIKINIKYPEEVYNGENTKEIQFIIDQIKKPVADWDILRIKEHYGAIARILNDPNWGKKYLVDFNTVPGFVNFHKSFIMSKTFREQNSGILLGPLVEGFYWAMFVNTDVAKKIGVEVKQYGMTFDDLLAYSKAVYDYNKTHKTHIAAIFEDAGWISTETMFKNLCYSALSGYNEIVEPKLTTNKINAIEKGYKALEELSKYKPIIGTRKNIVWGRDNDFPLKDSCLFFVNGSWMYNIWTKKNKTDIKKMIPCELPVFKKYDSYISGYTSNWTIPKNAPHKEQAIKLMMYWCRPEISELWVRYTRCPSGVKGNITSAEFGTDPFESFLYTIENTYNGNKIHHNEIKYLFGEINFNLPLRVIKVV